jgi:hypothetical protein
MTVVRTFRHVVTLTFSAAALVCLLGTTVARGQPTEELEAKVKAGFLINFARYVEWPTNSFASTNSPIVIGVLGQEAVGRYLDEMAAGKTIEAHPIEIKRARRASELTNCHIAFIAIPERDRQRIAYSHLQGKPVLTVSDTEIVMAPKGMILLKRRQGTMRFEINRETAEQSGLKISSKLLKLADNYRQ